MNHLKILTLAAMAAALMALAGAGAASATTLQSGGKNLPAGTSIVASLKAGTSSLIKDKFGTTAQTCTQSETKITTTNETGTTVNGVITSQMTGSCSHAATVIKNGTMSIEWTSGNNGKVIASGSETTFVSTTFGISCVGKTSSTNVGTLTGSTTGNATMDISGVISAGLCGEFTWTATYNVTSPSPLAVVK